ncbi:hypothetical protein SAMN05444166_4372 [Singulisphaera sp. GP187]|uniref:hypothetical protein n=1 Tax=Singulisphaera sp. GP187 TaxID=1882752 RepID=UPI000927A401|nr:hypothetical protein [Singulisphaera sp. GP187]SIO39857.1 hypothetical protein SAMN05444166_4372 [Singulisphaera sp. GP187]
MKSMKISRRRFGLGLALAMGIAIAIVPAVTSAQGLRQYYDTTWSYSQTNNYYYVNYYYQTVPTQTTYDYHYCIYYPSQTNYIYYYNPSTQAYWGRYEIGSKGDKRYSILAQKDRKKDLKEIPESAFPEPASMPTIPGAKDNVTIQPPPENVPKDKK